MKNSKRSFDPPKLMCSEGLHFFVSIVDSMTYALGANTAFHATAISTPQSSIITFSTASAVSFSFHQKFTSTGTLGMWWTDGRL